VVACFISTSIFNLKIKWSSQRRSAAIRTIW
jgi:hypothetical protein